MLPDLLSPQVPVGGSATFSLPLPTTPGWAGDVIHLQVVTLELAPDAATASNGVTFVLGRL